MREQTTSSKKKRLGCWVLGSMLLAVLVLGISFLVADRVLSSPRVKAAIQQTLAARTGLHIGYEKIGIGSFPFTLQLQQLTFSLPQQLHGKAELLRLSPALFDLLAGKLNVGTIELVRPDISLALAMPQPTENRGEADVPFGSLEKLGPSFAALFAFLPALQTNLRDGRFSVTIGEQSFGGEHLDLRLEGRVENARSGKASLQMGLAELDVQVGKRRARFAGLQLGGRIQADDTNILCQLDRLSLAQPALTLSGNLNMVHDGQDIALHLVGTDIDVDATRLTALALAADISPIPDIFTYLAGGRIPRITFSTQGKSLAELGGLSTLRIEGHLQDGIVAIPEIDMRLTEVNGDVVIADGVLTGTGLSTRLAQSTGHDGLLKLGLAEENDLFQLELLLNADLAQVKPIVRGLAPKSALSRELDRITNLRGTGVGKLMLGDDLNDINAGIEDADVQLSFDYQRVPHRINIAKGRVTLTKDQVAVSGMDATVGKSHVTDLTATVRWEKNVHLDISAKHSELSLDELFPSLNAAKETQQLLKDIKNLSGNVQLSAATFTGDMAVPQLWHYSAAGSLSDLSLQANGFPGPIQLAKGNFTFDRTQVKLSNLAAETLDANLTLTGSINNFATPSGLNVDLTVEGTLGKDAVAYLQQTYALPNAYAIRTPLLLKGVRIAGNPKQAVAIAGSVLVKDGPQLALDIAYRPGEKELKVDKLSVQDRYSQAEVSLLSRPDSLGASFSGRLHSDTLAGLFVDPKWGKWQFEGDFSVKLPKNSKTKATAKGRLHGTNLVIPLEAGEEVRIGQVVLEANGSSIKADAAPFSWRDFTWNPLAATIDVERDKLIITVDRAALCGIDSPGVIRLTEKDFDLDLILQGKHLDVATSYTCLTQGRVKMTGKMEISSHIKAKGGKDEIVDKLAGPLAMTFRHGVIEQNRLLSTLLEVLNVTEIVKGRLPNMTTTGFQYSVITVDGQFKNGKLIVDNVFVKGETLDILGFGEIDLNQETVNLELLAAPFKTVDSIIKYVPGVNYLLGDSLVVIPVHVDGALADPKVRVLPPSSVSKGLLNLGARVLHLPSKMMESIITGGQKAGKALF